MQGAPASSEQPASDSPEQRSAWSSCAIEGCLLACVGALTLFLGWAQTDFYAILSLYFLPVTLAGFLLGRFAAVRMALFCLALAVLVMTSGDTNGKTWISLVIWGGVLSLESIVIGSLCEAQRIEMNRLLDLHRADTLCDALTGVANRRAFDYEMNRRMAEWKRQRQPLSLLLLDIDHFKHLNDTYGHQGGDRVIHDVAQLIANDCRETDLVARYGGEEFAVVMPNTPYTEAMKLAERVRCAIEAARFEIGGISIKTSISVGLAQISRNEDVGSFIERVDNALYSSKQAGRNCSHFHDEQTCQPFGAQTIGAFCDVETKRSSRPVSSNLGHTESVTGLPAKSVFVDELRRRLSETRRYDGRLALMLVQVDELEFDESPPIDSEEVQTIIAEHIKYIMRDSDLVAFYDRDLFAVLMPSTDMSAAFTPAVRLRRRVAECRNNVCAELPSQLTVSIGLTEYESDDTVATILQRVDRSLAHCRAIGGNRISVFIGEQCDAVEIDEEVQIIDSVS